MSIRWGDSDSSDDEGPPISASSLTRIHEARQQMEAFAQPNESTLPSKKVWSQTTTATVTNPEEGNGGNQKGGGGRKGLQQGGGQGGGRGKGRGRSVGGLQQQNTSGASKGHGGGRGGGDWKQMAKASSKFGQDAEINLDGGSWMAQRRAKQQQQEEEQKKIQAEQKKIQALEKEKQQEENRQRRKSQMEALKAAVQTIEETQPPISSLQAAVAIHKPLQSPQPTKILKRHDKDEHDNESVTSFNSQSSGRSGRLSRKDVRTKAHEGGRGPGRGNYDRRGSERSFDSHGIGGRGKDRRPKEDAGGLHADSTIHSNGGRGGRSGGRGRTGGRGRFNEKGSGGGKDDHAGRGRGSHPNKGKLEPGKPQVVRTSSGTVEYHIGADANTPKTEAKLMPNGTVRLTKKNKGGILHGSTKTATRSPIRTKLEIGANDNDTK